MYTQNSNDSNGSDNHLVLRCYHCNALLQSSLVNIKRLYSLRLWASSSLHGLQFNVPAVSFAVVFIIKTVFVPPPLVCCFASTQLGLECGPFVWVMLICWGNECINFISTWPQSNNYQSRCVRSNHVKICQLIIKILFWRTWVWHELPRGGGIRAGGERAES